MAWKDTKQTLKKLKAQVKKDAEEVLSVPEDETLERLEAKEIEADIAEALDSLMEMQRKVDRDQEPPDTVKRELFAREIRTQADCVKTKKRDDQGRWIEQTIASAALGKRFTVCRAYTAEGRGVDTYRMEDI